MSKKSSSQIRIGLVSFLVSVLVFACFKPSNVSAGPGLSEAGTPGIPSTICLSSVPRLENFPDVSLDFRPLDSSRNFVSGISSTDIQAQENNLAPVPVNVNIAPAGIGLNIYFVIDIGNRTDLPLVATTLQSLSTMFQDNVDEVTIISDENNGSNYLLKTTKSLSDIQKAIQNLPSSSLNYLTINKAIDQALKDIKNQNYSCLHSNLIVVMSSGDTLNYAGINYQQYIDNANAAWTKLIIFHYPNPTSHILFSQPIFENLASGSNGLYRQILNKADIAASLPMLALNREREQYTATYRTNNSESSDRIVRLLYQSKDITKQVQTYSIRISNPTVTITSPANGTVIQLPSSGSSATAEASVDVEFSLSWPDGHPRNLKSASLIVISPSGTKTEMSISAGVPLKFNWNIGEYKSQNVNALNIIVTATDEFGLTATSQPVGVKISIIPPTPAPAPVVTLWIVYALYGIVAVLVVVLIIMGRRLAKFTSGAVKQLGVAITTILGGAKHKGTPLASIKVIDGPASMIGAEPLKIYAESVKLGRDPTKADFTFYTPDAISTVSGLHCQIERVKGAWRIVALSKKGSETFVDDQAIPFFEPYPLNDGQIVRMGYLAQQPVVFQFNVEAASEESLSEKKITTENLPDNNHVPIDDETRVSKPLTDDEQKETDNIFAEYRDEDKKN